MKPTPANDFHHKQMLTNSVFGETQAVTTKLCGERRGEAVGVRTGDTDRAAECWEAIGGGGGAEKMIH